ncbi:hypothetical protein ACRAWF_18485 [Streptomyces sp. L7]
MRYFGLVHHASTWDIRGAPDRPQRLHRRPRPGRRPAHATASSPGLVLVTGLLVGGIGALAGEPLRRHRVPVPAKRPWSSRCSASVSRWRWHRSPRSP